MEDYTDYASSERITNFISDTTRKIIEYINFVALCGAIGLFGIITNIINLIVFKKQGFNSTTNIAFFALAISDLCCLVSLEWVATGINPFFATSGIPWVTAEVVFLSGAWPHVCFCRITSFITIYVTAERYISISFPLKVKEIVTPRKTVLILCLIYFINILALVPEYVSSYLGWKFFPRWNRTFLALDFTSKRKDLEGLENVIHSGLGAMSFLGVIIFTVILVVKLKQASSWRKRATLSTEQSGSLSNRDQKTVKMVVLIASVLIICYAPGAVISMTTFIIGPEFNMKGKYYNVGLAVWSFAYTFQTINSSVNIFVYYNMSSKYRQTLKSVYQMV